VICHEAYEESLAATGINLKALFADNALVIPISKCESDYKRPLSCGDRLQVSVSPKALSADSFEIHFEIIRLGPPEKSAARVRTEHVCIDSASRVRKPLPAALAAWVKAG
jgi:1,4-dihydroxy-2-naphthoyl-CoA hydrolase